MRYIIVLILFTIIWSCKSDDFLDGYSDEQLIDLLVDIQIANAAVQNSSKKLQDSLKKTYKQQIIAIHKIEADELDSIIQKIHLDLPRYTVIIDSVDKRIDHLIKKENFDNKEKNKKATSVKNTETSKTKRKEDIDKTSKK